MEKFDVAIIGKNEDAYVVTTNTKEIIKITVDEKSALNIKTLEKLIGKKVLVKGTGSIEKFLHVFTSFESVTEVLPKK